MNWVVSVTFVETAVPDTPPILGVTEPAVTPVTSNSTLYILPATTATGVVGLKTLVLPVLCVAFVEVTVQPVVVHCVEKLLAVLSCEPVIALLVIPRTLI